MAGVELDVGYGIGTALTEPADETGSFRDGRKPYGK